MKKDMLYEIKRAREMLLDGGYTCVLYSSERQYTSTLRGVRPLLDLLSSGVELRGFVAADKTVGLGAAHLYNLFGVRAVWARVMSEGAKALLSECGIYAACECEAPYIINRAGDGKCPIEAAVEGASSSEEALARIKAALDALAKNSAAVT